MQVSHVYDREAWHDDGARWCSIHKNVQKLNLSGTLNKAGRKVKQNTFRKSKNEQRWPESAV